MSQKQEDNAAILIEIPRHTLEILEKEWQESKIVLNFPTFIGNRLIQLLDLERQKGEHK